MPGCARREWGFDRRKRKITMELPWNSNPSRVQKLISHLSIPISFLSHPLGKPKISAPAASCSKPVSSQVRVQAHALVDVGDKLCIHRSHSLAHLRLYLSSRHHSLTLSCASGRRSFFAVNRRKAKAPATAISPCPVINDDTVVCMPLQAEAYCARLCLSFIS